MTQDTSQSKQNDTGLQLSGVQITFAMIIAFGLILAINFSSRIAAGQPLQEAYREVEAEVEQLQAEQATLTTQRDYSQSDAYVEQWARGEGKMIRDGETLVVPVPAGAGDGAEARRFLRQPSRLKQATPNRKTGWCGGRCSLIRHHRAKRPASLGAGRPRHVR